MDISPQLLICPKNYYGVAWNLERSSNDIGGARNLERDIDIPQLIWFGAWPFVPDWIKLLPQHNHENDEKWHNTEIITKCHAFYFVPGLHYDRRTHFYQHQVSTKQVLNHIIFFQFLALIVFPDLNASICL